MLCSSPVTRFAVAFFIILSGCGGGCCDPEPAAKTVDNHGYGWEFDAVSKGGLRLRQSGATARDADHLEAFAVSIETCTGLDAPPPPFVIVVPRDSLGQQRVGLYMSAPPLLLVDEGWRDVSFAHETVHYLLDWTYGIIDATHQNSAWRCAMTFQH